MKIIISNADPTPIYAQISSQIQKHIVAGELSVGAALPSIRKLALDLQISVITTKRAYDELERDGFINSVTGKGSYVAEQSLEMLSEKRMKQVEDKLAEAVKEANVLGISLTEMQSMLNLIYGSD
ncbi:MAG: GntR family transcriptional regulator [Candidatus Marinimicrobia bacterium]|nr:GntR family transcriptional regulator [Candidatus Neomarinimicrobiota bacterium]